MDSTTSSNSSNSHPETEPFASEKLSLSSLTIDERLQLRERTDDSYVLELKEWLEEHPEKELPRIVVYRDANKKLLLTKGFHRYSAYKKAGREKIPAFLYSGGFEEALVHALRSNAQHGMKRTREDKRKALGVAFQKWPDIPAIEAAKICEVGRRLAEEVRKEENGRRDLYGKRREGPRGLKDGNRTNLSSTREENKEMEESGKKAPILQPVPPTEPRTEKKEEDLPLSPSKIRTVSLSVLISEKMKQDPRSLQQEVEQLLALGDVYLEFVKLLPSPFQKK